MSTTTPMKMNKAELARQLNVSRTYITLLANGKRKPSKNLVDKLTQLGLTQNCSANKRVFEHLTFNQGVTGSRPVRPIQSERPTFRESFIKNQGVKSPGKPTP